MIRLSPLIPLLSLSFLAACSEAPERKSSDPVTDIDDVKEVNSEAASRAERKERAGAPVYPDVSGAEIPPHFRGEWRTNASACGNARDTMGVTITSSRVLFYESEGKVRTVRKTSEDRIAILADYTGEGDSWSRNSTLRLTESGELLMDDVKRVRCS